MPRFGNLTANNVLAQRIEVEDLQAQSMHFNELTADNASFGSVGVSGDVIMSTARVGSVVLPGDMNIYQNGGVVAIDAEIKNTSGDLVPSAGNTYVTRDYVTSQTDALASGVLWIQPVDGLVTNEASLPGVAVQGDRYILNDTGAIWEYSGALWFKDRDAVIGMATLVEFQDDPKTYIYMNGLTGNYWYHFGVSIDHDNLLNSGANSHAAIDTHLGNTTTAHFGQNLGSSGTPSFDKVTVTSTDENTSLTEAPFKVDGGSVFAKNITADKIIHGGYYDADDFPLYGSGLGFGYNTWLAAQDGSGAQYYSNPYASGRVFPNGYWGSHNSARNVDSNVNGITTNASDINILHVKPITGSVLGDVLYDRLASFGLRMGVHNPTDAGIVIETGGWNRDDTSVNHRTASISMVGQFTGTHDLALRAKKLTFQSTPIGSSDIRERMKCAFLQIDPPDSVAIHHTKIEHINSLDGSISNDDAYIEFSNTLESASPNDGAAVFKGGVGFAKNVNVGGDLHAVNLDAHIGDATIHFTEGSIDHAAIANIGTNSHAAIDTHIGDATAHFTEGSIDHTAITNIGTNSHAAIDAHIGDTDFHFYENTIDHRNISYRGDNSHATIDNHLINVTNAHFGQNLGSSGTPSFDKVTVTSTDENTSLTSAPFKVDGGSVFSKNVTADKIIHGGYYDADDFPLYGSGLGFGYNTWLAAQDGSGAQYYSNPYASGRVFPNGYWGSHNSARNVVTNVNGITTNASDINILHVKPITGGVLGDVFYDRLAQMGLRMGVHNPTDAGIVIETGGWNRDDTSVNHRTASISMVGQFTGDYDFALRAKSITFQDTRIGNSDLRDRANCAFLEIIPPWTKDNHFTKISHVNSFDGTISNGDAYIQFTNWLQSNTSLDGAIVTNGGVGIKKNLNVGGVFKVEDVTDSTSISSGSVVISGGVGIAKNVNVAGVLKVEDSTDSTSQETGALIVTGGIGAGGRIYGDEIHQFTNRWARTNIYSNYSTLPNGQFNTTGMAFGYWTPTSGDTHRLYWSFTVPPEARIGDANGKIHPYVNVAFPSTRANEYFKIKIGYYLNTSIDIGTLNGWGSVTTNTVGPFGSEDIGVSKRVYGVPDGIALDTASSGSVFSGYFERAAVTAPDTNYNDNIYVIDAQVEWETVSLGGGIPF